jgi:hypothetical protein
MRNRKYLIIPTSEIKKVNFDEIKEHSPETLSYSGDGKKTFIKWSGKDPSFLNDIKDVQGPHTHSEILEILRSKDWISSSKNKPTKKVT